MSFARAKVRDPSWKRGVISSEKEGVRLMFDYLHGDVVKQISPTNVGDAGSTFNAFAMRTQVAF